MRLVALTDSALNIEVGAMFDTIDGGKFMVAKERVLLGILRIVEEAGVSLAHPVRTVELASQKEPTPPPAAPKDRAPRLSKTG